jgi:CBS domain-containing protein
MSVPPAPRAATVAAVMVSRPKVLPATASVGDARAVLADEHVHMVLLVEGSLLRGTVVAEDLPSAAAADGPALARSRLTGRTVPPSADAGRTREQLAEGGGRRLAVVDDEGRLLGLLCLKQRRTGFCSDADVAGRTVPHPPGTPHLGRSSR